MDKKDLKQIREEFALVIEDNINPQFEELNKKSDKLEEDIRHIKGDIQGVKEDVHGVKSQMVTKAYLDEKLIDLTGDFVVKLKKEDAKVNRLIEMMDGKKILDKKEIKELGKIKVFPQLTS